MRDSKCCHPHFIYKKIEVQELLSNFLKTKRLLSVSPEIPYALMFLNYSLCYEHLLNPFSLEMQA